MSNGIGSDPREVETRLATVISRICNSSDRLSTMEGRLTSTNNILMGAPDSPMQSDSPETASKSGAIGKAEDSLDTLEQKVSYMQDQINRLCDSGII